MAAGQVIVQVPLERMAERLRIRRGMTVRWTHMGVVTDYRVTRVGMPDNQGRVEVDVEPA